MIVGDGDDENDHCRGCSGDENRGGPDSPLNPKP